MSSETQPDEPSPDPAAAKRCPDKQPHVVIRIRPTVKADSSCEGSTNIDLLNAVNALESYQAPDSKSKVTKYGGRTFRTPVYGSLEEDRNGKENCLSKTSLSERYSEVVEGLRRWVQQQTGGKDLQWSVWISPHLYADLNLALDEGVIHYDSIQVFFIGENLPPFVLTLYDVLKSPEPGATYRRQDESGDSARKFALQLAKELTVELHKFCCVDFLILPCVMTYAAFTEDLLQSDQSTAGTALWQQIEREHWKAQWYYSGPLQLSQSGYRQVKEAASITANVSYVPCITNNEKESERNRVWLFKFPPKWQRALSLLVEALGSTESVTFTLTCSEDKYPTLEMILLEASRRWALSHDVLLRVPLDSRLAKEETQKDLRRLTGKRKHPSYRMEIQTTHAFNRQEIVCERYKGESETAHRQQEHKKHIKDSGVRMSGSVPSKSQETEERDFLPDMSGADQPPPGDHLVDIVKHLYPDALTRTYLVPPVRFNRVPYSKHKAPGIEMEVLVLPSGEQFQQQQATLQADFAQHHVLHNLQQLAESTKEVMFVVSELNFKDYFNKPFYAKQTGKLPKPGNLPKEHRHHGKQGDFDILVIHRQHGILVGEMKSVGRTEASQADSEVAKVIGKAVQQLDKCEVHARHMVSDVAPGLTVSKTLFLPYVSRAQLQRILDDPHNAKLQQAVCGSLGAANTAEAVQLCCCSDQLSQPASYWHVTPAVLSQLSTWWTHLMARTVDTVLTEDLYLHIVARLVGPATTVCVSCPSGVRVEVRTAGQAVAELGRRLAEVILTLQQLDLMNRNPPRVHITGPPGTGKTTVLVLQGVRWLLEGHDVQLVSSFYATQAVSRLIRHMVTEQLQRSLTKDQAHSPTPGTLFYHRYDLITRPGDVEQAVSDLMARVKDGRLYVIMDEAHFNSSDEIGQPHYRLVSRLTQTVPSLHLWTAGVFHSDIPSSLQQEPLTVPLRSAPAVLREVQPAVDMAGGIVHKYSSSGLPAPGDGQRVIRLSHSGDAHTGRWPVDCFQCGKNIANELCRLGVGCSGTNIENSTTPLSYRDVLILTRSSEVQDNVIDHAGRVTSLASAVVRGLRDEGLPVCVLGLQEFRHNEVRWESILDDVAVGATDRVTVAQMSCVHGLERRVVVVLPGRMPQLEERFTDYDIDRYDRLIAVSRCTTQLFMVDVPSLRNTRFTTPTTTTTNDSYTTGVHGQASQDQRENPTDNSDTGGVSWCRKGFLLKPDKPVTARAKRHD